MTNYNSYDGTGSYPSAKNYSSSFDYSNLDSRSRSYLHISPVDKLEYKDFFSGDSLLNFY